MEDNLSEDSIEITNQGRIGKLCGFIIKCFGIVTIEPAIFLQTFSWGLQSVIAQNLMIEKVCRDFKFSEDVCHNIDQHPFQDNLVQKYVATLQMYASILGALPCIFISLCVGPWSDLNGRKPLMILPLIGFFCSQLIYMLNVYYEDASAEYILFSSIYGFFGGITTFSLGMYAYLADQTSIRARTSRIAFVDLFLFAGLPTGTFASAVIYKHFGYYAIFGSCGVCQIVACIYICFLKDTRGPSSEFSYPGSEMETNMPLYRKILTALNVNHVKDVFCVTFKRRNYNLRKVILLLIIIMLFNVTAFHDIGIMYLYVRKKFDWNEQQFTQFQTAVIVITAIATLIVMPALSYWLQVHDAMIGILATLSKMSSLIVIAIAPDAKVLFLGACLGFLSSMGGIVIRSILSKCASHSELGKIFSVLASLEAAVPLFSSILLTLVYNSTIDSFVGAVFLVEAAMFALAAVLFSYVFFLLTRTGQDFALLVEAEEENLHQDVSREQNSVNTIS